MIGRAGRWTRTPSATPLQPKKLNAHSKIMFNFWRLAGLVDGLKPHLSPLSSQKNEMLVFGLPSTSDDWPGWSMDLNPICHPSPAIKNEMLIFGLHSTSDVQQAWSMDLNPICHPSAAKNMKCSFLDYIQFPMIGQAGQWTQTPSATPRQWKNEMLVFGLHSTSDDRSGWSMELNPIYHLSPGKNMKCSFLDYVQLLMIGRAGRWTGALCATSLQPKKWNAHFQITFNFWWLAGLVNGLEPHLPPLSSQKNEMLIFGLRSTSDDQEGWLIDLNPICDPSPATKMKCSFLDYVQLLMISWTGQWTQTPSTTPLQPKTWNACFWITFNFWWLARLVDALEPHLPPLSSHKNEMLIFGLRSTSDNQLDWSLDSNAIHHPSPAKNMKCLFLDNVQLLMISQGGQWTWAPSATPLQPKKMKCSFLDYVQLLMISPAGQWTQIPSATSLQPKKWNAHFWIMFNFWWSAGWSMDSNSFCQLSPAKKRKCLFLDYV